MITIPSHPIHPSENKRDTRKYPIVYFDTPTRPEPNPLPGILFNTRPDPILKNPTRWALGIPTIHRAALTVKKENQGNLEKKKKTSGCDFYINYPQVVIFIFIILSSGCDAEEREAGGMYRSSPRAEMG